jgi:predicted phage baseplate assembly protein
MLGSSSGEPGQTFHLDYAPILALMDAETVEVEEKHEGEIVFVPWQYVPDFAHSTRYDRHFSVETASGAVGFGPSVRQPDGTVRQYGRIPEAGRQIRFTRYRRGGGAGGNVPAENLQVLTTSLAYVSRVSNLHRASGGRDPEDLEEVKARARRELRAQLRAVTAEDYEHLARQATRSVARVKCNTPRSGEGRLPPGTIEILVVPAVADALRAGNLSRLQVGESLTGEVSDYLEQRRLLTTILRIREPAYLGVKVHAEIIPSAYSRPEVVRARVVESLRSFISPLALVEDPEERDELTGEEWKGWPFGRNLYLAEIVSLIQRVPGVKHVLDVQASTRPVVPAEETLREADEEQEVAAQPLTAVEQKTIRVPADTLLCSLDHEVVLQQLETEED